MCTKKQKKKKDAYKEIEEKERCEQKEKKKKNANRERKMLTEKRKKI